MCVSHDISEYSSASGTAASELALSSRPADIEDKDDDEEAESDDEGSDEDDN